MTSMHATNKPFNIDKRLVYEAYKAVESNRGAAGVDEQTIEQFEADLSGNLYKIWNRMSSGTYFAPPVCAVAIPKKSGGGRILGVPVDSYTTSEMPFDGRGHIIVQFLRSLQCSLDPDNPHFARRDLSGMFVMISGHSGCARDWRASVERLAPHFSSAVHGCSRDRPNLWGKCSPVGNAQRCVP
jgi:hypothetical protein